LEQGRALGDQSIIHDAMNVLGLSYYYQDNYDSAITAYQQALSIKVDSPYDNWKVLKNMGDAYYWQTNYQSAVDAFLQALPFAEKDGRREIMSDSLLGLGDALFWQENYNKAIEQYARAIPYTDTPNQRRELHSGLGRSYVTVH
ncbi:MAG: tetratricopeptide repeat protein, partial [Gammaproteobacteria bacterium]|nr:tetratricopeptide repeat protein [Gammaproteobacteria bacterium]